MIEFRGEIGSTINVAGLYFALTQLTHRNISQNHKFQAVGLGWAFADSVLHRLAPLWVGARGLEFTWDYILQGLEANANLENFSLFMVEMAQARKNQTFISFDPFRSCSLLGKISYNESRVPDNSGYVKYQEFIGVSRLKHSRLSEIVSNDKAWRVEVEKVKDHSIGWETVVKDIRFCSITLLEFQVFGCSILNMRLAPNQSLVSKSQVAIFLIQRNRHALIGRAIDDHDMRRVLEFLKNDPVVDSVYDYKSETDILSECRWK
ncbi:hypothetical protein L1987_26722 [Smallanthus sonchifolius]|uniref:Uncharacterized protein n=1 Tax=Smallanthus sonchifolius TaxID=185202 RepID=A0ACB9IBL5_9ASTR|nr:hypothetical protein L1987_26722 [Smallanthus sonchifolius]